MSFLPDFIDNAVGAAGKVAGGAVDIVNDAAHTIGKGLDYIPVIGPLYSALWTHVTSPLDVFNRVVQGQPINTAFLDTLHSELRVAKTVAPYAQMVMQIVPGVGPIASGAISAGIALAEGQTIDQALLEGVKGALPGGPLAKAAFTATQKALQGQNIGDAISSAAVQQALSTAGVSVPDSASTVLAAGVNVSKGIVQGKDIKDATVSAAIQALPAASKELAIAAQQAGDSSTLANTLLNAGREMIPNLTPEQQAALDVSIKAGLAMGTGQYFQEAYKKEVPGNLPAFLDLGKERRDADNALEAALKLAQQKADMDYVDQQRALDVAVQKRAGMAQFDPKSTAQAKADFDFGFTIGAGLMVKQSTQGTFNAVRSSLTGRKLAGFDTAVAYSIGRVRNPVVPGATPFAVAGYNITKGMIGHTPEAKAAMMVPLAANPDARAGAVLAITEVTEARSWWRRLLSVFGL